MKKPAQAETTVHDPATGREVVLKGFGSMKDRTLNIREGLDLTKPIFDQVIKLDQNERSAA